MTAPLSSLLGKLSAEPHAHPNLEWLAPREQCVIALRAAGVSYNEVGDRWNITSVRAREIYHRALKKLADIEKRQQHEEAMLALQRTGETPIENLDLSVRTYHCLKQLRIDTIEQLQATSDKELLVKRNLGPKTLAEIHAALRRYDAVIAR